MSESDYYDWRTRGIGASDIAGILEISPWASPYSVWASKCMPSMGGGGYESEPMKWGKLLEDAVIDETARRLDLNVYGRQTRCQHPKYEWARATVDAFCRDDDGDGVIEAKTTGEPYWNDIPAYYEAQVLWQIEVTGREYGWLAALHNGRKLSLWRVEANPPLQQSLIETAEYFWETFVVPRVPPMLDGKAGTTEALNAQYPDTDAGSKVELDEHSETLEALGRVRADLASLETDKAALENTIKAAMGSAEAGTVDGKIVVTWKPFRSRRIDLDLLRSSYPAEAASCETVTESRRFLVKTSSNKRS